MLRSHWGVEKRTAGRAETRSAVAWSVVVLALVSLLPTSPAQAQPPRSARDENPLAPAPEQVGDLTSRYKLVERYTTTPEKAEAGDVGQYRVAIRDVLKVISEKSQGTPERKETSVQTIFTERPVLVNSTGVVTDTIRHYEAFRVSPAPAGLKPSAAKPLDGLTVWEKLLPGGNPLLISLTKNRGLTETESSINARVVFMPALAAALPALPSRVGDRWRIPKSASMALLGERAMQGDSLTGTLIDVRKGAEGGEMSAIIGVTGHALMPPNGADTALNARITFRFSAPAKGNGPGFSTGPIEARGRITELRLAKSSTAGIPGSNGRLKRTFTHELILQRPLADPGAPIALVDEPKPTTENSWLRYDDPQGRFTFRHPQELQVDTRMPLEDSVQLVEITAGGFPDKVFTLQLQPKTGKPDVDRNNLDPEFHIKTLAEEWSKKRQEVIRGPSGWLPEADWQASKLKVYRIEAAFKIGGASGASSKDAQRVFFDYYLVLTSQNESLAVTSMTADDPPLPYRNEVESILRTIQLGPAAKPEE